MALRFGFLLDQDSDNENKRNKSYGYAQLTIFWHSAAVSLRLDGYTGPRLPGDQQHSGHVRKRESHDLSMVRWDEQPSFFVH